MTDEPRMVNEAELNDLVEQRRVDGYLMHFDMPNRDPDRPASSRNGPGKTPGCWVGGAPTLPPDIPWPTYYSEHQELIDPPSYYSRSNRVAVPMIFLGQVDLARLPVNPERPEIPREGTLFFFYEPIFEAEHSGEGKVIYVPDDVSRAPQRLAPTVPTIDYAQLREGMGLLAEEDHLRILPHWTFTPIPYVEWDSSPISYYGEEVHPDSDRAFLSKLLKIEKQRDDAIAQLFNPPEKSQVHSAEILTLFGASEMQGRGAARLEEDSICVAKFRPCRLATPFDVSQANSLHFVIEKENLIARDFTATWVAH